MSKRPARQAQVAPQDIATQFLLGQLHTAGDSAQQLWLADENTLRDIAVIASHAPAIRFISNRYDVAETLTKQQIDCPFSDFDFEPIKNNSLDRIYYRVSKEKPVVHHIINQSYLKLKPGGKLYIAGLKNEGIKTYFSKLKTLFSGPASLNKSGTLYAGFAEKSSLIDNCATQLDSNQLDTTDYTELRPVAELLPADDNRLASSVQVYSKPGLFGWNKIDQGSAFLIEKLDDVLNTLKHTPESVLDLGCGYGYLSLMTQNIPFQRRCATDNNAAALRAANYNFTQNGMIVEVIADDCGAGISEQFDLILCNPPFHQGFSIDGDLTHKFLHNTQARLRKGGTALFVVNQFIPLERKAKGLFADVRLAAENRSFKLVQLS